MKNNHCTFINYILVNYYITIDVFTWTFITHIQFILQHIRFIFIWAPELKVTFLAGLQWKVARMGLLASLCLPGFPHLTSWELLNGFSWNFYSTLKREAACSSETLVMLYQTTQHHILGSGEFCDNLLTHSKFA